MSIWNRILLGLIFIASAAFFYMGARVLRTHEYWRNNAMVREYFLQKEAENQKVLDEGGQLLVGVQQDQALEKLRAFFNQYECRLSVNGETSWADFEKQLVNAVAQTGKLDQHLLLACKAKTEEVIGITQAHLDLSRALVGRGRAWFNCGPQVVDADKGQVSVAVDLPDPHGIADKTVLYVFEEAEPQQGGRYLGEFKVVGVDQRKVGLEPTRRPNPEELKLIANSRGPWTLYEDMPTDEHDIFADLTDEQKQEVLPKASVAEYLKDGREAQPGDPEDRVIGGKYVRRLRDYAVLLERFHVARSIFADLLESYDFDIKAVASALKDAQEREKLRQQDLAAVKTRLAEKQRERDAVLAHLAQLQPRVDAFRTVISQMMESNRRLAAELARVQLEAKRRIDQRTGSMARADAAGN